MRNPHICTSNPVSRGSPDASSTSPDEDRPSIPWLYHLAVDDGTTDRTAACSAKDPESPKATAEPASAAELLPTLPSVPPLPAPPLKGATGLGHALGDLGGLASDRERFGFQIRGCLSGGSDDPSKPDAASGVRSPLIKCSPSGIQRIRCMNMCVSSGCRTACRPDHAHLITTQPADRPDPMHMIMNPARKRPGHASRKSIKSVALGRGTVRGGKSVEMEINSTDVLPQIGRTRRRLRPPAAARRG
jgi:hypothetical protein